MTAEIQASLETVGRLKRRVSVVVPFVRLEQAKNGKLNELAKTVRLDGFRPGKVPLHLVEQLYGKSVWAEITQQHLETSLREVFQAQAVSLAGEAQIDSIKAEPGSDLEYTAVFEIYPELAAPELKDVCLERLQVEITSEDVDAALERIRHHYADWTEVSRPAQTGDKVVGDVSYPSGGSRKDMAFVLDAEKLPKDFSGLWASKVGDLVPLAGPQADHSEPTAPVTMEIKQVSEPKLPDLDDHFIRRLGLEAANMDVVRAQLRESMQQELDRVLHARLKDQVVDQLFAQYPLDVVPQVLVDKEFQRLLAASQQGLSEASAGAAVEQQAPLSEAMQRNLTQEATKRVTLGLLFNALIDKYQLSPNEERAQQKLGQLLGGLSLNPATKAKLYQDKGLIQGLRHSTLEDQVIDRLLQEVEYADKVAKYSEVMGIVGARADG